MKSYPHVVALGGTLRQASTSLWALQRALDAAERSGATTDLLSLRELDLPFYEPGKPLQGYGPSVRYLIQRLATADAILLSSAAYHGTLAGVTKNALDFLEFLRDDPRPYLSGRTIGLIATAGGDMAQVHTVDSMVHIVHSLRGVVAPLQVAIPHAQQVFGPNGEIRVPKWAERLDALGRLVVEMSSRSLLLQAAA